MAHAVLIIALERVLQRCCCRIHDARQVDDLQLVYLQNMILVANEAVTDAFEVYEEDQDPVRLADSLKHVRTWYCV